MSPPPDSVTLLSGTVAFLIAGFAVLTMLWIVFNPRRGKPRRLTSRGILLSVALNGVLVVGILAFVHIDPSELLRRAASELPFVSWFRRVEVTDGWQQVVLVLVAPHLLLVLLGWAYVAAPASTARRQPSLQDGPPRPGGRFWFVLLVPVLGAGVVEESLYRLALPAALLVVTDNLVVSLLVPLAFFALGHLYQGWAGVLRSAFLGSAAALLYLVTGNILLCIFLHALWNANALLVLPAFFRARRRKLVRAAIRAHRTAQTALH